MTKEKLDELERLHAAATPGPWFDGPCHWGKADLTATDPTGNDRLLINGQPRLRVTLPSNSGTPLSFQDAALIAAARNTLPELLRSARLALKVETYLRLHGKELCMATALAANRSAKTRELFHPVGMELDALMKEFGVDG